MGSEGRTCQVLQGFAMVKRHHLHDPGVLWHTVLRFSRPGTALFIMDLRRPDGQSQARKMVELYGAGEAEILGDIKGGFFQLPLCRLYRF